MNLFLNLSAPRKKIILLSSDKKRLLLKKECLPQKILTTFIEKVISFLPKQIFIYTIENGTSTRSELAFIQGFLLTKNIPCYTYGNQEIFSSFNLDSNESYKTGIFSLENTPEKCEIFQGNQSQHQNITTHIEDITTFLQSSLKKDKKSPIYIEKYLKMRLLEKKIYQNHTRISSFEKDDSKILDNILLFYQSRYQQN